MTGKIPKTSQLYYFLMPEETTKVLAFIKDQKCSLYSTRSRFLGPEPIKCDPASIPSMVFICPEGFNNEIDMIKISEGVYVVDPTTSPVIEMQCSIMRKKELSRGRCKQDFRLRPITGNKMRPIQADDRHLPLRTG